MQGHFSSQPSVEERSRIKQLCDTVTESQNIERKKTYEEFRDLSTYVKDREKKLQDFDDRLVVFDNSSNPENDSFKNAPSLEEIGQYKKELSEHGQDKKKLNELWEMYNSLTKFLLRSAFDKIRVDHCVGIGANVDFFSTPKKSCDIEARAIFNFPENHRTIVDPKDKIRKCAS